MGIISAFYGIVVRMYYNEGVHQLPHFHVRTGTEKASVALDGTILSGHLSGRTHRRIREWLALHNEEIRANWERGQSGRAFEKIEPLP